MNDDGVHRVPSWLEGRPHTQRPASARSEWQVHEARLRLTFRRETQGEENSLCPYAPTLRVDRAN